MMTRAKPLELGIDTRSHQSRPNEAMISATRTELRRNRPAITMILLSAVTRKVKLCRGMAELLWVCPGALAKTAEMRDGWCPLRELLRASSGTSEVGQGQYRSRNCRDDSC